MTDIIPAVPTYLVSQVTEYRNKVFSTKQIFPKQNIRLRNSKQSKTNLMKGSVTITKHHL